MNVLCAVGLRGGEALVRRLFEIAGADHDLHLLHVIDTGPRHALTHLLHGPRHRPPQPEPPPKPPRPPAPHAEQERRIDVAEEAAAEAAMEEARLEAGRLGFRVHLYRERGNPEELVAAKARTLECQLVVIHAREGAAGRPQLGPASIGHSARFVLDHAPCDVLLVRTG
jgi:nucleotide-binding universal stress UspA family protein